jgi:hypothetical protein
MNPQMPGRRRRDGRWTSIEEPGPIRRFLGYVFEVVGRLFWWW